MLELLEFQNLSNKKEVKHFISTRKGGVSLDNFAGLNLGLKRDDKEKVQKNRELLARELGISVRQFVFCHQMHGKKVETVTGQRKEKPECDAMITDQPGLMLTILVADCVPIVLFDPIKKIVGVAHAGWRGTVKRVSENIVRRMAKTYNVDARDIIAGIGPSIGPQDFEVGPEVIEEFRKEFPYAEQLIAKNSKGNSTIDLWKANQRQLIDAGLRTDNIEISGISTYRKPEQFFSYRKQSPTGHFGAGIMLTA